MVTLRARELLIGANLAHMIAALDRIADRFTAAAQERIALQLYEIESEANDTPRRTVH